jgi:hypothetical protein
MTILILEDCPERTKKFRQKLIGNEVTYCTTSQDCIVELQFNRYDVLMLDHDLGGKIDVPVGDNTGYGVVKWLVEHLDRVPDQIFIHSLNRPAAEFMVKLFKDYGIHVHYVPFLWDKLP